MVISLFTHTVELLVALIFIFYCLLICVLSCIYYVHSKLHPPSNPLLTLDFGAPNFTLIFVHLNIVPIFNGSYLKKIFPTCFLMNYDSLVHSTSYRTGTQKKNSYQISTKSTIMHAPNNNYIVAHSSKSNTKSLFFSKIKAISIKIIKAKNQQSTLKRNFNGKSVKTTRIRRNMFPKLHQILYFIRLVNLGLVMGDKLSTTVALYRSFMHHRTNWVLLHKYG